METLHGVYTRMECQSTWSVETLCNIYMDTNMDMDTECIIRSFVCNTKRPSVKQSMKWQVSSKLADLG